MTTENRRQALRTLIEQEFDGVSRRLALAIGKPDRQINDMLSDPPRKSFGERMARHIEQKLGLPDYFLDRPINALDYEQRLDNVHFVRQQAATYETEAVASVVSIMKKLAPEMQDQVLAFAEERLILQSAQNQNSTQRAGK